MLGSPTVMAPDCLVPDTIANLDGPPPVGSIATYTCFTSSGVSTRGLSNSARTVFFMKMPGKARSSVTAFFV